MISLFAVVSAFNWLRSLGGFGIILLALVDNSVIPVPGSVDLLTIILAARNREIWYYYDFMAVIGSVLGGYITYRLGKKGGTAALESRISKRRLAKVYRKFENHAFLGTFIPALLPPPFPMSPFLIAAGALNYPLRKFLAALALGRLVRYTALAYLASLYGNSISRLLTRYERPMLWISLSLLVLGIIGGAGYYSYRRQKNARALREIRETQPDIKVA